MEGGVGLATTTQPQQPPPPVVEKLNPKLEKELNLESLKTRALSLFKAISRILEDFDAYGRTNTTPKWQDILGQYSMVNLELFNIVEEVKKVSNAFVVLPKNVNAVNAGILPVMLSSKLLPEMETDDNAKREQLLQGVQSLPIPMQIERLKARMDMIAAACENAEKVLADTRKAYGFGARQGPSVLPTMDKGQAAKIQEQENMLRAAVNDGAGTRLPPDQRQITTALPPHLADVLIINDAGKIALPGQSNNINNQGMMQVSGTQFMGRSAASPSGPNFDNTTSPLPYSNSPRATGMVNAPSPQQQILHQQLQQQQRAKLMQMPQHQQQLLAQQQQLRQSSMQGLGQIPALHDLHGQPQQKFQTLHGQHQMSYSQPMAGHQQLQARQLSGGHIQHSMSQGQLNPAMNRHLNQFSSGANSALFTSAQGSPSSQMIPNMSSMQSQTVVPRMQQFGVSGTNPQRSHSSQMLGDQMFNSSGMMQTQQSQPQQPQQQQQQQQQGGGYGNMQTNQQLQSNNNMMQQNAQQRHQQNPQ
ncbi:PREDICTED: mediator of RNA polymerase II transcription subunit 8-like [Camelina sativa]|uniref:Mediator of RNA polymerase II transcription subunit 8-like n=1 Tax=Camelina sativa TaxID=90675 RepID=A0ABM1RT14_CAMSA|nr:PREDICTED: mediator of RNA polymerase II transcription subunit 8-like [Camelina sativa]XP_019102152.1 PREDICTED: mediator of RNA polymerase II transcription subunit 8-like [Camelina sativa]XP_019102153.1 PREDICTED: mediator of RNA polymerase II transcription subunit 8-like [Camelina sativa]